ncbi:MAG TPA: hypothetical protein VGC76_11665 [Pyrinomonadaceae bacterium]|jgi:hypothetical protein
MNEPETIEEKTELTLTPKIIEAIINFLKAIGLKPAQCELIRAFLKVCEGQIKFEASNAELAQNLYPKNATQARKNIDNARYSVRALEKWQAAQNFEIIRIIEKGGRKPNENDKYEYFKSKYEFVILGELAKVNEQNPEASLEENLEKAIEKLKEQYKPSEEAKKYHPVRRIQSARKTILTKIEKIFELNVELGENPVKSCEWVLKSATEKLNKMEAEWSEQQHKEKMIADFENLVISNDEEDCSNEETVIDGISDSMNRVKNYHLITTSK